MAKLLFLLSTLEQLYDELINETRGATKFEAFNLDRLWESAIILVRYGINTLEAFRTTDGQARKYFFEDLRKKDKLSFLEMGLILKLNRHIPPHDQKTSDKNIRFTELDIPQALKTFAPSLASISASLQPEKEMANWINKQKAIASAKDPPYIPYLVPKLTDTPWMPPSAEHTSARANWLGFSKQAKRTASPQEMSIQCFALYHLRFIVAAELCKAWDKFGGLSCQLSHLSTILNLAIVENVGTALAYHKPVGCKLQEKARQRSAKPSDFTDLLSAEVFTLKEQAKREIANAVEKDKKEATQGKEQKERTRKQAENGPGNRYQNKNQESGNHNSRNNRNENTGFRARSRSRRPSPPPRTQANRDRQPPQLNAQNQRHQPRNLTQNQHHNNRQNQRHPTG